MKKENLHSRGMLCGGGANQPYCASRWRRFAAFFYSRRGSETMTFLRRGVYGVMSLWVAIFYAKKTATAAARAMTPTCCKDAAPDTEYGWHADCLVAPQQPMTSAPRS